MKWLIVIERLLFSTLLISRITQLGCISINVMIIVFLFYQFYLTLYRLYLAIL